MKNSNAKCMQTATVIWNRRESPDCYRMGLQCAGGIADAVPGQFVMVRLEGRQTPLLRRPFSIHSLIVEREALAGFEILYKVVGDTTASLASCDEGQRIDVLGPLGNGFRLPDGPGDVFIVSGGIGVAPFPFLVHRMQKVGCDMSRATVFLGGRSKDDLLCSKTFEQAGMELQLTTDDGSAGDQALVTESFEKQIEICRPDTVYACGPVPMLRQVVSISKHHDLFCQVSIETIMACGMGACLGCAVEGGSGDSPYRHACIDGPVFDAKEINL